MLVWLLSPRVSYALMFFFLRIIGRKLLMMISTYCFSKIVFKFIFKNIDFAESLFNCSSFHLSGF